MAESKRAAAKAARTGKAGKNAPPPIEDIPLATREEVVADRTYRLRPVVFQNRDGDWRKFLAMSREVPWSEQMELADRHKRIIPAVGGSRKKPQETVNARALTEDLLRAAVKPEECQPPLTAADLLDLKGSRVQALIKALELDDKASEEEEEEAGESGAP